MLDLDLYQREIAKLFASSPTLMEDAQTDSTGLLENHISEDWYWFEQAPEPEVHSKCPLVILREAAIEVDADSLNAGNRIGAIASGETQIQIVRAADNPGKVETKLYRESKRNFMQFVSNVMDDVLEGAGREDNIAYRQVSMIEPAMKINPERADVVTDMWIIVFSWRYGGDVA